MEQPTTTSRKPRVDLTLTPLRRQSHTVFTRHHSKNINNYVLLSPESDGHNRDLATSIVHKGNYLKICQHRDYRISEYSIKMKF
jgi:hypothetical protein